MVWQVSSSNTKEYRDLDGGWKTYVKDQRLPDVYWDPTDRRWETYALKDWTMSLSAVPAVKVDGALDFLILQEVFTLSSAVRALNGKTLWNPRDGQWYSCAKIAAKPPPRVKPPPWMDQMNAELEALDQNLALSPEERQRARLAVIDGFTSGNIH